MSDTYEVFCFPENCVEQQNFCKVKLKTIRAATDAVGFLMICVYP